MDFTAKLHHELRNTKLRIKKKYEWDDDLLNMTINEYSKFLILHKKYPGKVVPGKMIDKIWHDHILHTQKYISFCEVEFGKYIHHVPNDLSNDKILNRKLTYELYENIFGYKPSDIFWGSNKYKHLNDIKNKDEDVNCEAASCGDCVGT